MALDASDLPRRFSLLQGVLEGMFEAYEIYLQLAEKLRKALVNNNVGEVAEINLELDAHVEKLSHFERLRLTHMEILSGVSGEEIHDLRSLLTRFPGPWCHGIANATERLKERVAIVQKANKRNTELIQSARGLIQATMSILAGQATDPRDRKFSTYGGSGSIRRTAATILVDRKG